MIGVMVAPLIVTADLPTLVSETDSVCELFSCTVPKFRLDGEALSPATFSVKFCAVVVTTLVAERTMGNAPEERVGVPASVLGAGATTGADWKMPAAARRRQTPRCRPRGCPSRRAATPLR